MTNGFRPLQDMPIAPDDSGYIGTGNQWIDIQGIGSVRAYAWNDAITATDPGVNRMSCDNASIALATELYINATSVSGIDSTAVLEIIDNLDFFVINRALDQLNNWSVKAIGPSVDNGGWFTIPIEVVDSGGGFLDGGALAVEFVPCSPRVPQFEVDREIVVRGTDFTNQDPVGTDNPMQVTFGPGTGTGSDPVHIDSAGVIHINEADNYHFRLSSQYGRAGSGGVAWLWQRVLVNGTQAGVSVLAKLINQGSDFPYQAELTADLPAGVDVTVELWRDSVGFDDGGYVAETPTLGGTNAGFSADVIVSRYVARNV